MKTTNLLKQAITSGGPITRRCAAMEVTLHLDEYLPWLAARKLEGVTVKEKEGEWLMVVKATYRKSPQVAFIATSGLEELYYLFAYALLWDLLTWKPDKWRSMRIDES